MSERRWQLTPQHPTALQIAADARISPTDYTDDQVWEVVLGKVDSPALALQTRYGGRAGLASLVPMWIVERRPVYQYQAYAVPPTVTSFAPGFVRLEAKITPTLSVRAEYWVIESHAVGGRYTVKNTSGRAVPDLALELVGFVGINGQEVKLSTLPRPEGGHALLLGQIGTLQPAVLLENGTASPDSRSKLRAAFSLPPRGQTIIRFVHAGLGDVSASLALAQKHLAANWTPSLRKVAIGMNDIPEITTGDENVDAALAFSYHHLVQSFLQPTASLPYASFVATRRPYTGFSPRRDGTDYPRSWSGQAPTLAYLSALAVAPIQGKWGWGVLQNYLAIQRDDGWIDWKPGLGGQKQGVLCLPILARLAWGLYQYTENTAMLREVYPKLSKFFGRWLQRDLDIDGDGFPEWQNELQTGYPFFPTFAQGLPYGQNADIRTVESPDLLAYLLSEAICLGEIAYLLGHKEGEKAFADQAKALQSALEALWNGERYTYRDRDTNLTTTGRVLLKDGRGDEEHFLAERLDPPNRLIVQITGGVEHTPKVIVYIDGVTAAGEAIRDVVDGAQFVWSSGRGTFTTQRVYQQVDRVHVEGLSRVYAVTVSTLDTTGVDINGLLPLWSAGLPPERAAALLKPLAEHFTRKNGVVMVSTRDPRFDPKDAEGGAGVRPFWLTLIGEGLIETGQVTLATDLLKRLIHAQTAVLTAEKSFFEFYHPDEARGLGEPGNTNGIIPLHLLLRVLGIRIVSKTKVWTGGSYHWGSPVTVTQYGVTVKRSPQGIHIEFPSGKTVSLAADAVWQEVKDGA